MSPVRKLAVLVPSTNTVVEPELAALRPPGVEHHTRAIVIPNASGLSDASFVAGVAAIRAPLFDALRGVEALGAQRLLLGISALSFLGGARGAADFVQQLEQQAGLPVTVGSFACVRALQRLGARRIGLLSPYWPAANAQVAAFLADHGITVQRSEALCCDSWTGIAAVGPRTIAQALQRLAGDDVDALLQVGTNLRFAAMAPFAEAFLGLPVVAVNPASYADALAGLTP